jgi:ribosomal protein S18
LIRNRLFFEGCDTCDNCCTYGNHRRGLLIFCGLHSKRTLEKEQWRYMFHGDYICKDYKNKDFQELKRWITWENKIKSRWIEISLEKEKK